MGSAGKSGTGAGLPPRRGSQARTLRIIGGTWRGRKWRFPEGADIRPTPDRVRETLFNWLGGRTQGARCLDLFAGSGALGLEALSRGAAHVSFVDSAEPAVRELRLRLAEWQAIGAQVERSDALAFLAGRSQPCDIVFLDPPFAAGLLAQAAARLQPTRLARPRGTRLRRKCRRRGVAGAAGELAGAEGEACRRGRVSSVRAPLALEFVMKAA